MNTKTERQQQIANELASKFGIDPTRILFLNKRDDLDPWIPPSELMAIAREHGNFQEVAVAYDKYIPETQQVVCIAKVIKPNGIMFSNFGVATAKVDSEIAADVIASGRALSAVLTDAGFNPLKSNPVIEIGFSPIRKPFNESGESKTSEALQRTRDIRRIKALATDMGMIVSVELFGEKIVDDSEYRWWLANTFPDLFHSMEKPTIIQLDARNRQRIIDKLMEEKHSNQAVAA